MNTDGRRCFRTTHSFFLCAFKALISTLQGPESGQWKAAGQKMTSEDRHRRLITLRSHHLAWKMGNSGDSAPNFKILEEGRSHCDKNGVFTLSVKTI